MSYKTDLQGNNTDLQTVLSKVNALPSGAALGDATAADVVAGKTFSSASGIKVKGTLVPVEVVTGTIRAATSSSFTGLPTGKQNLVIYYSANMSNESYLYGAIVRNGKPVAMYYYRQLIINPDMTYDANAGTLSGGCSYKQYVDYHYMAW